MKLLARHRKKGRNGRGKGGGKLSAVQHDREGLFDIHQRPSPPSSQTNQPTPKSTIEADPQKTFFSSFLLTVFIAFWSEEERIFSSEKKSEEEEEEEEKEEEEEEK